MLRALKTILILALVIGVGVAGYLFFGAEREPQEPDYEVVSVRREIVTARVSAMGTIMPGRQANLTFKGSGRVSELLVAEGALVEDEQLLASLDVRELELALEQAQVSLEVSKTQLAQVEAGPSGGDLAAALAQLSSAQASYEQVSAGPNPEDISTARANLTSAQAALRTVRQGPSEQEITVALSNLEQARISLELAQAEYDRVSWMDGIGALPQSLNLQQATINYEAAQANYELATQGANDSQVRSAEAQVVQAQGALDRLLSSPSTNDLTVAEAQVAQAQANYDRLLDTPSEQEVAIARQQVRQAEIGVAQAELMLSGALLTAPFAGTVVHVNIEEQTMAQPGVPALTLVDLSHLYVDVSVDEIDIPEIGYGQEAILTLDALPGILIPAYVERVAPTSTIDGGIVSYQVRVGIIEPDHRLRAGMTANVEIITARHPDALVVPNRAIRIDRQASRTYLEKLVGQRPVETDVEVGVRGEQFTQILTGLTDGDQVIIRGVTSLDRLRETFGASGFGQ
jgi:HlyD family secretion protein